MTIYFNSSLNTLDGLDSLNTVGGAWRMYYNFALNECCAIYELINGGIAGAKIIFYNKNNCNSEAQINNYCNPNNLVAPPTVHLSTSKLITSLEKNGGDLGSNNEAVAQLSVFPNPASGEFDILVENKEGGGQLQLFDSAHRLVWQKEISDDNKTIRWLHENGLNPGLYFLVWKDARSVITQKLIIQ